MRLTEASQNPRGSLKSAHKCLPEDSRNAHRSIARSLAAASNLLTNTSQKTHVMLTEASQEASQQPELSPQNLRSNTQSNCLMIIVMFEHNCYFELIIFAAVTIMINKHKSWVGNRSVNMTECYCTVASRS